VLILFFLFDVPRKVVQRSIRQPAGVFCISRLNLLKVVNE
jgi:hypothetical protein